METILSINFDRMNNHALSRRQEKSIPGSGNRYLSAVDMALINPARVNLQSFLKSFLLLFLLVTTTFAFSQLRKADAQIQKLNNGQFIIDHSQKANFKMSSPAALKLIKTGKPATDKLLKALNDSTKTIMAHLVLCHIYFKHVSFAGPKVLVTDKGDLNKYYLGEERGEGLVISETNIDGKYSAFVLPGDRAEVIEYWKRKLNKSKP